MKNLPQFASLLYCEPWAILPQDYGQITSQFDAYVKGGMPADRLDADDPVGSYYESYRGEKKFLHPQVEVLDDVALVRVHGILGKHLSRMMMWWGFFDMGLLTEQLRNIETDEAIKTVVIDFRTPGGAVTGVETAALAIRKVSDSGKRVIGYTDDKCASGGYWLASACDEFYAEGSALVGSISTFCVGVDSSKQWKDAGLELQLFRTGDIKGIGLQGKAWTAKEKAFMQAKTDSIDKDFKSFVRSRRNLSYENMQGNFWYAKHAPQGVVDGIVSSLNELLGVVMNG